MKSKDLYSARASPVVTFDPHRFRVLDSGVRPKQVLTLLPSEHHHLVLQPEEFVYRSDRLVQTMIDEGSIAPARPYWDVSLRQSRRKRLKLFTS